VKVEVGL